MFYYHPLTLGVRRPWPAASGGGRPGGAQSSTYEAWREGLGLVGTEYEEHPAARVLEELRRAAVAGRAQRPWLVLGEPGAGKSTLLQAWFEAWAGELAGPRLGLPVPVLVRLRELRPGDLDGNPEVIADRLWHEHGAPTGAARCADHPAAEAVYRAGRGRAVRPVWLLDGLDELDERLRGERPLERLVALPGAKLVTCRTAVFQAMRSNVEAHKEGEFEILPLKPAEQETFLTEALTVAGRAPARAGARCREIQANAALRPLAGNPMMLRLIAEAPDDRALPATRAAFYREAVGAMWSRKLDPAKAAHLREARDRALTEAARRMALEGIEADLSRLADACRAAVADAAEEMRAALERAGLVWVDPGREVFGFVHLTFQEFYLARALEPEGLRPALERRWAEARYEETLALLISRLLAAGRVGEVDVALCWLIDWGALTHRRDPRHLWRTGRSPLRVALHLLRRAGARWTEVPLVARRVEAWLRAAPLGRLAVAADAGTPPDLLAVLARNAHVEVRGGIAWNPAASAELLATLAHDAEKWVRHGVAQNPSASAELLAALAHDADKEVRRGVAWNRAAPAELLAALARDADQWVRRSVAENSAAPAELLAALACDADQWVRLGIVGNPSAPVELLAALARDADQWVRRGVAENSAPPAEVLAVLARDAKERLRRFAAKNSAAPAEALAALARDADVELRRGVALSLAAPAEALAALARDADQWVRCGVACNPAAPAEALAPLARDANVEVRRRVAWNPTTPAELLAALARDAYLPVRRSVAWNPYTFVEDLSPQGLLKLVRSAIEGIARWKGA